MLQSTPIDEFLNSRTVKFLSIEYTNQIMCQTLMKEWISDTKLHYNIKIKVKGEKYNSTTQHNKETEKKSIPLYDSFFIFIVILSPFIINIS